MRLLVLSPWLPYPPQRWGAAMRNYQILRLLAARHEVTLLAYGGVADAGKADALRGLGVSIQLVPEPSARHKRLAQAGSLLGPRSFEVRAVQSKEMQAAIDGVLRSAAYDAILVEFSQMACFRFPPDIRLIVDEHNIEFELHRRLCSVEPGVLRKAFNWLEYVKLRREEVTTWRRFDACLVTSAREVAIVRRHAPRLQTAIVPNGVDLGFFEPQSARLDPNAIVFTGRMNYRPNADAAVFFVREVLPRVVREWPQATFYIVGQDPAPEVRRLSAPHVIVTGLVDDVRPYLAKASAVVAPIRAGSGTRLKILEALAMGKAVVSTSLGAEGLDLAWQRDLLVADEAEEFARSVLRLLRDPQLGGRLGQSGRSSVMDAYGWPTALRPLDELLPSGVSEEARLAGAR